MQYLEMLGLAQEPFSTSPDPLAYYRAPEHEHCLHRLEVSIRLKRGLNVVIGDVGTGKSTLSRCLLRALDGQDDIIPHLILDPGFESADEFARYICRLLADGPVPDTLPRRDCIEAIQNALFSLAVERGRIVLLCIDEGQKLAPGCLEVLRELLNYETNTEKLLQIVIFGQRELEEIIDGLPNFKDRINEYLVLRPLDRRETIRLVRHRLRLAGGPAGERLFTLGALLAVHKATRGYPRRIMRLCHQLVMTLLITNKPRITARSVRDFLRRDKALGTNGTPYLRWVGVAGVVAALVAFALIRPVQVEQAFTAMTAPALSSMRAALAPHPAISGAAGPAEGQRHDVKPAALPLSPEHEQQTQSIPQGTPDATTGHAATSGGAMSGTGIVHPTTAPSSGATPPERLGALVLPKGETMLRLLETVYGRAGGVLDKVLEANPGITNPNMLPTGTILTLPALPLTHGAALRGVSLAVLSSHDSLEAAYAAYRNIANRQDLMLMPIWTQQNGLRFMVALAKRDATEKDARALAARIGKRDAAPTLLRDVPPETVIYRRLP